MRLWLSIGGRDFLSERSLARMLSQSWWGSPSEQALSSSSEPVDTVARQLPRGGSGEEIITGCSARQILIYKPSDSHKQRSWLIRVVSVLGRAWTAGSSLVVGDVVAVADVALL